MRFLLVDSILEWEPGKRARGVKNVSLSEDFRRPYRGGGSAASGRARAGPWTALPPGRLRWAIFYF